MSRTLASMLVLVGWVEAASAQPPPNAGRLWTDDQIERWVFQTYGNASASRRELASQLTMQIVDIHRACSLSDAQKKKLQMAGRGDIKRFFDRYQQLVRKSQVIEQNEQNLREMQHEINHLRISLQAGLFDEHSLLVKSLPNALTSDQFARYDTMARERHAARHSQSVQRAITALQRGIRLREEQRRELTTLITNETKPPRRSGPYEAYVLLLHLSRLPEEKLKPLFDEDQWKIVSQQLARYGQMEPMLRQEGALPAEEDEADSTAK
jgi:hypothetical protein